MNNLSPIRAARPDVAHRQSTHTLPPVVTALDQATAGKWSFEVISHETAGEETVVVGRLVIDGRSRAAFGGTIEKGPLAYRLHLASLDALTRAAGMMGIVVVPRPTDLPEQTPGPAADTGRITRKQLDYALSLARDRGIPRDRLVARCLSEFKKKPEYLTRAEASELIETLRKEAA